MRPLQVVALLVSWKLKPAKEALHRISSCKTGAGQMHHVSLAPECTTPGRFHGHVQSLRRATLSLSELCRQPLAFLRYRYKADMSVLHAACPGMLQTSKSGTPSHETADEGLNLRESQIQREDLVAIPTWYSNPAVGALSTPMWNLGLFCCVPAQGQAPKASS